MTQVSLQEVSNFAVSEIWEPNCILDENACLLCNFQIAGEDGKEFIEAFAKEFNMDISKFDWVEIFGPETGGNPFGFVIHLFQKLVLKRSNRDLCGTLHVTLKHLQICANNGKWHNPHGWPNA